MHASSRFLPALRQLLVLAGLLFGLAAYASEPGSGELRLLDRAGQSHHLASLDTDVEYRVNGLVAEVQVRQQFRNTGTDWLEGEYLLPLPPDAAVYTMSLQIGERRIVAQIQRKEAAQKIFAHARANGQQAALVEADNGNLFRTAVTNVAPGETVTIVLHYWQRIDYHAGEFSLRFPLTYTPRYHMHDGAPAEDADTRTPQVFATEAAPTPVRTRIAVQLNAGVPLATVDSPSHAIISNRRDSRWDVQLRDSSVLPDRDFVLRWRPQPQTQPNVASFRQDVDGTHYAMLMLLPPQQYAQRLPRELILIIDTSGSMGGEPIRQARAALDLALS